MSKKTSILDGKFEVTAGVEHFHFDFKDYLVSTLTVQTANELAAKKCPHVTKITPKSTPEKPD
jgi:hypothetical protein